MKYCPNCGYEAEKNFCPECGTPMQEKLPRCPKCGTESEGKFCPNCGASMEAGPSRCPKCGTETESAFCPNCGAPVKAPAESAQQSAAPAGSGTYQNVSAGRTYQNPGSAATGRAYQAPAAGGSGNPALQQLGWHKFLIYFALWFAGVVDVYSGIVSIKSALEIISYGYMTGIGVIFLLLGIVSIGLGGALIYIRFQLAAFKRNAPKLLLIANICTVAINGISTLIASFVFGAPGLEFISSVAGNIVFLVICKIYYDKRAELFIN